MFLAVSVLALPPAAAILSPLHIPSENPLSCSAGRHEGRPTPGWWNDVYPVVIRHLDEFPPDIDIPFLGAWIENETDGRHGVLSKFGEVGYFQLHLDEIGSLIGHRADNIDKSTVPWRPVGPVAAVVAEIQTNPDASMRWGAALLSDYDQRLTKLGVPRDTNLYYGLMKAMHWSPSRTPKWARHVRARLGFWPTTYAHFLEVAQALHEGRLEPSLDKPLPPKLPSCTPTKILRRRDAFTGTVGIGSNGAQWWGAFAEYAVLPLAPMARVLYEWGFGQAMPPHGFVTPPLGQPLFPLPPECPPQMQYYPGADPAKYDISGCRLTPWSSLPPAAIGPRESPFGARASPLCPVRSELGLGFGVTPTFMPTGFLDPVPGAVARWGWGDSRAYRGGWHEGLDFPAPDGFPVFSAHGGIVTRASVTGGANTGQWVTIADAPTLEAAHADDYAWQSQYMHLSKILVAVGQPVFPGQLVGLIGGTGTTSGRPHLHFAINLNEALLPQYIARYGAPTTGFGRKRGRFVGVPAEPLIPTEYHAHIREMAALRNVVMYTAPIAIGLSWGKIAGLTALLALATAGTAYALQRAT